MENKNIELVKGLLDKFFVGDGAGLLKVVMKNFMEKFLVD